MVTNIKITHRRIGTFFKNLFNKCMIPLVIIHLRYIQRKYYRITVKNIASNQSNQVLNDLRLLQSKEHYYYESFSAWGKYHPSCVWTHKDAEFFKWLFPKKNFKQIDLVLLEHQEGVVVYTNIIWDLINKGKKMPYPGTDNFARMIEKHLNKIIDHQTMKPKQYRD